MTPQISALQEEVKRLREALGLIAKAYHTATGVTPTFEDCTSSFCEIAKKALSSTSNLSKVGEAKEKVIETAKKLSQGNSIWDSWDDVDEALKELDIAEKEAGE